MFQCCSLSEICLFVFFLFILFFFTLLSALLVLCRGIFRAHCVTAMDDVQVLRVGLSQADKTWKVTVRSLPLLPGESGKTSHHRTAHGDPARPSAFDPESCSAAIKVTHGGGRCTCRLKGYLSSVYVAGFCFLHTIRLVEFMKEDPDPTDASSGFGGRSWSLSLCCAHVYPAWLTSQNAGKLLQSSGFSLCFFFFPTHLLQFAHGSRVRVRASFPSPCSIFHFASLVSQGSGDWEDRKRRECEWDLWSEAALCT